VAEGGADGATDGMTDGATPDGATDGLAEPADGGTLGEADGATEDEQAATRRATAAKAVWAGKRRRIIVLGLSGCGAVVVSGRSRTA
jgi:hypothetical protein